MLGLILTVIVIIIDFIFSIWNSYNAGQIYANSKKLGILFYILGGFLSLSYIVTLIITLILAYLNYLPTVDFSFILNFDFLFFGLAIVMWGVIATTFSFMATVKGRRWSDAFVTIWNAFVTIWDAYDYISNFMSAAKSIIKDSESNDFSIIDVIIIVAVAVGISFIISYAAFKEGMKRGRKIMV